MEDVRQPSQTCMMCTIDGDTIFSFRLNILIEGSSALCHIMNNNASLLGIININELIQGCSGNMSATEKGSFAATFNKLTTEWVHFYGHNVLLQGRCRPVFPDVWTLAGKENFKWSLKQHSGQIYKWQCHPWSPNQNSLWMVSWSQISLRKKWQEGIISYCPLQKDVNNIHAKLGHLSKSITHVTAKAMSIQVTGIFKPCEDCALNKAKQRSVSKMVVAQSKIFGERLFFNISFSSTPTFGGKKHWLFVIDDSSNYIWSFFLKEKLDLAGVMLGLIKLLKNKYNLEVQYLFCDNAGENIALEKAWKQEGLGFHFKYTAPSMPQQNGCIKREFATLFNQVHACSTVVSSMLINKMSLSQSCEHCQASQKKWINSK